ncbi:MAG: tRNA uridine(34) 5-carboxymethylaminomethyl modification radical SAM/GNAT enzyme Elp3 [bacterium]|nr:tRNA uridine(34) 5-carboxymethylaminomethyl modification radical SAM/GNAT enzyme Elp3 [bacterium]
MDEKIIEKLIIEALRKRTKTAKELDQIKRKYSTLTKAEKILKNSEILSIYYNLLENKKIERNKNLEEILRIRKIRTLSGVAIVAILTKPYKCPGSCFFCPTQKNVPKSYLKDEPAVMRAIMCDYNPYKQVKMRIRALEATGHNADKIELIVIGGTWSFLPKQYQNWFIKECFRACDEYGLKENKFKNLGLEKLQKINEKSKYRIIGITLETRPDFINEKEIKRMRKLGCTRVEIGVQTIFDKILKINKRGHLTKETILATKLLKDAGFKICYHLMPNLPGSDIKKDKIVFEKIFSEPEFQPDLLKIYPCVVLKTAPLYKWFKTKKYRPYSPKQLVSLLKFIKKTIPYYCRIQRLIRDIPTNNIVAGCLVPNLRQELQKQMRKEGWQCKCIRCREVRDNYNPKDKVKLFRQDYESSEGKEIFLSFETTDRKKLFSLLRLRIPSQIFSKKRHFIKELQNSAIIRELHTFGQMVPISEKKLAPQHKGLGKKLIKIAEKITQKEFGLDKISVISGIGVKEYYRKLGYKLGETYMIKGLNPKS